LVLVHVVVVAEPVAGADECVAVVAAVIAVVVAKFLQSHHHFRTRLRPEPDRR